MANLINMYVNNSTGNTENAGQQVSGRVDAPINAPAKQPAATPAAADEPMSQLLEDRDAANTRTATATVLRALTEAGLPKTPENINLVNALIENGISIGRDSIRSTYSEVKAFPGADPETIIAMNRADIALSNESVDTVREFLNNSQVLTNDISELADMIESVLSNPDTSAETAAALRLAVYDATLSALQGEAAGSPNPSFVSAEATSAPATAFAGLTAAAPEIQAEAVPYRIVVETTPAALPDEAATEANSEMPGSSLSAGTNSEGNALGAAVSDTGSSPANDSAVSVMPGLEGAEEAISEEAAGAVNAEYEDVSGLNDYSFRTFDDLARALDSNSVYENASGTNAEASPAKSPAEQTARENLLLKAINGMPPKELKKLIKSSLSISPEKLSRESIRELYKRTTEFIGKVKEASEQNEKNSALHAKANQAMKDTAILNSLNRLYPHIELPLKLQNANAEGGLYVYTNKKTHASSDGHVSALLHLNMPNLGPVDIHLDLKDRFLGMKFYTESDAGVLLRSDLDSLRKKLESMDYSVIAKFGSREDAEKDAKKISAEASQVPGTTERPERLSFDIRA